jgi:SNW domain-containing protein 1
VAVGVDARTGESRWDGIVSGGRGAGAARVQARFSDLVEAERGGSAAVAALVRARPDAAEEAASAAATGAALGAIVGAHADANRPAYVAPSARADAGAFVRYTPSADTQGYSAALAQRIVRVVEAPVDPLAPAKHKHKKVPGGPGEAPVPVMHSPPRKLEDAAPPSFPEKRMPPPRRSAPEAGGDSASAALPRDHCSAVLPLLCRSAARSLQASRRWA